MKQQSANQPPGAGQRTRKKPGIGKPAPPLPTVGAPLDGSQYQNIIEEQKYSEQRPSQEEQRPRRTDADKARERQAC